MMRNLIFCLVLLLSFFLTSCNRTLTYDYLVLHLDKLEKAYSECQSHDAPACPEVKRAAHDMSELVYEQARDPEVFGKRIIAQQWYLHDLRAKKAPPEMYNEQFQKLQKMYAVVASHGPQ